MANDSDIRKNGSGYYDPTAYKAIKSLDGGCEKRKSKDLERYEKLIKLIFEVCELAGFHLESRIVVKDKKTGRIWR